MIARRLATLAATLGLVAALIAPFRAERVLTAYSGNGAGSLGLWMIVPVALGALGIAAVRTESVAFVWATVGGVWGFVILGAWSLGLFFAWEALALLAAGVLHLFALGFRWKLLLVPVWLVAGATALCPILLAVDVLRQAGSHGYVVVTHAPIVVSGSLVFFAASTLIVIVELLSRVRLRTG